MGVTFARGNTFAGVTILHEDFSARASFCEPVKLLFVKQYITYFKVKRNYLKIRQFLHTHNLYLYI